MSPLLPLANQDVWISREAFFCAARNGAWRDALSAKSNALCEQLTRERYAPDLPRWMEDGEACISMK